MIRYTVIAGRFTVLISSTTIAIRTTLGHNSWAGAQCITAPGTTPPTPAVTPEAASTSFTPGGGRSDMGARPSRRRRTDCALIEDYFGIAETFSRARSAIALAITQV